MAPRRRPGGASRPRLGQHDLRRPDRCAQLVDTASLSPSELVVEIGAGTGALTRPLAERAARVIAVELDPRRAEQLRDTFGRDHRIEVVEGDFLRWPLPREPYTVFANPPFAHSAAIVRRLTEGERLPDAIWLVLEDGAARRFAGSPFAHETLRSLLLKPEWHVEIRDELGAGEFSPRAGGPCALLALARRTRPLVAAAHRDLWADFVAFAFGRRGNSVEQCLHRVLTREQLRRCGRSLRFDPRDAPSALGFEQWLGLFRCFEARAGRAARRCVRGAMARLPR